MSNETIVFGEAQDIASEVAMAFNHLYGRGLKSAKHKHDIVTQVQDGPKSQTQVLPLSFERTKLFSPDTVIANWDYTNHVFSQVWEDGKPITDDIRREVQALGTFTRIFSTVAPNARYNKAGSISETVKKALAKEHIDLVFTKRTVQDECPSPDKTGKCKHEGHPRIVRETKFTLGDEYKLLQKNRKHIDVILSIPVAESYKRPKATESVARVKIECNELCAAMDNGAIKITVKKDLLPLVGKSRGKCGICGNQFGIRETVASILLSALKPKVSEEPTEQDLDIIEQAEELIESN